MRMSGGVTVIGASPRFGHPIPKTLVIWVAPSHITLAICVMVRLAGDAYITRVLGMEWACPYYSNSSSDHSLPPTPLLLCVGRFALFECFWLKSCYPVPWSHLYGVLTLMSIWYDASSSLGFVLENVSLRKQLATVIHLLFSPCTVSSQAFSVNAFWWRVRDERKLSRATWHETHRPRAIMRLRYKANSPLIRHSKKREGNWIELTFAETFGIVTRDMEKIDHLHNGVIFTTTGSIIF